jgi:hypothetical protein
MAVPPNGGLRSLIAYEFDEGSEESMPKHRTSTGALTV